MFSFRNLEENVQVQKQEGKSKGNCVLEQQNSKIFACDAKKKENSQIIHIKHVFSGNEKSEHGIQMTGMRQVVL